MNSIRGFRFVRAGLLVTAALFLCGGRLVFHDFTLEGMILRSDLIAVVENAPTQEYEGPFAYRFRLLEVLYARTEDAEIPEGKEFIVLVSDYDLRVADDLNRQAGGKGISYAVSRYVDGEPALAYRDQKDPIILFAQLRDFEVSSQFELAAQGAFEPVHQKAKIKKLIKALIGPVP